MNEPRAQGFSSEILSDGRVLVVGGNDGTSSGHASAGVELLDAAAIGPWSVSGSMATPRRFHETARISGDRVLAAGGHGAGTAAHATAEIWSPGPGSFSPTGPMQVRRQSFALATLANGRVLATGGSNAITSGAGSASAEIYDPSSNTWSPAASMNSGRLGHSATLLPSCDVLIVGDNPTSELYVHKQGQFTRTGSESPQRSYHTATLLADGRVLVAGGVTGANTPLATASIYDPASGNFENAGTMSVARTQAAATLLADGRVLVAGGFRSTNPLIASDSVDIYNPASNSWSAAPPLPSTVASAGAHTLANGVAAVVGGAYQDSGGSFVNADNTYLLAAGGGPAVKPPALDCSKSGGGGTGQGPALRVNAKSPQRAGRPVRVRARVNQRARVRARAVVVVRRGKRNTQRMKLRPNRKTLRAGKAERMRLAPRNRKQRRKLRRLVARGARARARITVVAVNGAGDRSRARTTVRLRRR